MIKYILILIGIILSMLGLAEFIHGIRLYCISPKKRAYTLSVVFLDNICPEQQLTYAAEQQTWLGKSYADRIVAVDCGLEDDNRLACDYIARKSNVTFCTVDELCRTISRIGPFED